MRDYGKISPQFWTGKTGKQIRGRGFEAQLVALYLVSSPHSNMLGLYYQPLLYMAHETGLGIEGARKGLQGCIEAGFCAFDEPSEMVWVFEMAGYQIANELKATDKRCSGIQKDYDALPDCPFLGAFFDKYRSAFHIKNRRQSEGTYQAPSEPHRSQEQEQEQEQNQEQEQDGAGRADAPPPAPPAQSKSKKSPEAAAVTLGAEDLHAEGVSADVAAEFLKIRKTHKAPLTPLALAGIRREADSLGWTLDAALRKCVERGWRGLEAAWVKRDQGGAGAGRMSSQERAEAEHQKFLQMTGGGLDDGRTIEMEV